jgi:hypothetical protein
MPAEPEIRIEGDQISVLQGKKRLTAAPLSKVIEYIDGAGAGQEEFAVRPRGARIVQARRDAIAMGLEIAPHTRRVRWLADDSKVPFGPRAKYAEYFVSFPFIVLLLVFRRGGLTGQQQLYYRNQSLDSGDDLLLPNLYNVAVGYGQRCWVCLQHCPNVGRMPWDVKIATVVDHIFSAAFNRSSEEHEGNSYWSAHTAVDPRVASMETWQEATRADRRMALSLAWTPAGTTAGAELRNMLDQVVRPRKLGNATDFAGIVTAAAGAAKRPRDRRRNT